MGIEAYSYYCCVGIRCPFPCDVLHTEYLSFVGIESASLKHFLLSPLSCAWWRTGYHFTIFLFIVIFYHLLCCFCVCALSCHFRHTKVLQVGVAGYFQKPGELKSTLADRLVIFKFNKDFQRGKILGKIPYKAWEHMAPRVVKRKIKNAAYLEPIKLH